MRILLITNGFPVTATDHTAAFAGDFVRALKTQGHDVTIVTPGRDGDVALQSEFVISWIPWGGRKPLVKLRFWNPVDIWHAIQLIYRGSRVIAGVIQEQKPDVLFALWAAPSGTWARIASRRFHIPYAVWCLGSDIWIYPRYPIIRGMIRRALHDAQHVFADGELLAQHAGALANIPVAFLPTSRVLPKPLVAREAYHPATPRQIVFIGRYEWVKGVDVLIAGLELFVRTHPSVPIRAALYGIGDQTALLDQKIQAAGLQSIVIRHGVADTQTAADALARAHWCIIPSRNESIPVVLSDALQLGTPVIVTDVGDMGNIVRRHECGLVLKPDSAESLCQGIEQAVCMDEKEYTRYAMNTARAYQPFNNQETAQQFIRAVQPTAT